MINLSQPENEHAMKKAVRAFQVSIRTSLSLKSGDGRKQGFQVAFFLILLSISSYSLGNQTQSTLCADDLKTIEELYKLKEEGDLVQEKIRSAEVERVVKWITFHYPPSERCFFFVRTIGEPYDITDAVMMFPSGLCQKPTYAPLNREQVYQILETLVCNNKKHLETRIDGHTIFDLLILRNEIGLLKRLLAGLLERQVTLSLEALFTMDHLSTAKYQQGILSKDEYMEIKNLLMSHRLMREKTLLRFE